MKKLALIVAMIGAFLVLVSIALNSWAIRSEMKKKMANVREAKAKKKEAEYRRNAEEEIKEILNDGNTENTNG